MKWKTALLAAGALFAGFNAFLGNRQLVVAKEVVYSRKLPDSFEGLKVMLLADLHHKKFGKDQCFLLDSVKAASPDIIIFAGDLYSKDEFELDGKVKFIKALNEIAPVYYAPGNHEMHHPDLCVAMFHKLKSMGINALRNEMAVICRGSDRINIYGLQMPLRYFINKDGSYKDLPVPDHNTIARYLGQCDPDHCDLLIGHNPLFFEAYERWGADIVFSGHVHGGVIRLPIIGGLLSPERRFFPKYTKGLYRLGKTVMAVTAGLGKFRINDPSEIMLLTLTNKKQPSKHMKGHAWDI
ncbi:MAG: metallophosphoesterase [Ruminococcus albus]|jgi:hypothetical protein|nr:metallophosphoesterase [Ruminococcus albus]